jgi:hypothetical protein
MLCSRSELRLEVDHVGRDHGALRQARGERRDARELLAVLREAVRKVLPVHHLADDAERERLVGVHGPVLEQEAHGLRSRCARGEVAPSGEPPMRG